VVPFWQELLYLAKVDRASRGKFLPIPVFRYGHCNFTSPEVLAAFGLLVQRATGAQVSGLPMQYDAGQVQRDFLQAQGTFQAAAAQVEADR
jgi:hypothetical protein